MNIADALDRNKTFFPERDAVVYGGRTWSYRDFWEQAGRAAGALRAVGVGRDDKVCLFLTNCPEFLFAYYGCQKLGAVCVSISSMSKADEVEYMANDSEGVVLVTERALLGAKVPVRDRIPGVRHVVTVDEAAGHRLWADLLAGESPE